MSRSFEILQWDSNFFGFKVAKMGNSFCVETLQETLAELRAENVKLAYCFVAPDDFERNEALNNAGGKLVDQKVKYCIEKASLTEASKANVIHFEGSQPTPEMFEIALQTSEHSRFRIDKGFGHDTCNRLYQQWITNSVKGQFDDTVFVYTRNDEILGLVSLKLTPKAGKIGLLGVDKNARGLKVGTALLNQAISFTKQSGIDKLEVYTQKANKAACEFYEKNSLKSCEQINVYHLWL